MYTLPLHAATSVVANNALPQGGHSLTGNHEIPTLNPGDLEMTIKQDGANGIIKWDSFDVGGSATVNFEGNVNGYNTLNYVNGGNMSQIYGTINANNNGNIYIVNPAGVQIGNSAQINVGSLYVSNKKFTDTELKAVNATTTVNAFMQGGVLTNAELMSLGNINITNIEKGNVTFEGNRIVIDTERIKNDNNEKLDAEKIIVNTSNEKNVVIGYEAYDETNGYQNVDTGTAIATVNGGTFTKENGYMWVEDVEQLQAINTNLGGNYALRNSIDATATDNGDKGFNPIGLDDSGKVIVNKVDNSDKYGFYGNFDGIDYNIFGLTIDRSDEANVGLFGVAHDANINNVTLVGGSITGGSVVGSVVGAALGNTHITNATNSASVTGNTDVGGIVGYSGDEISDGDNGNIIVNDTDSHFANLVNTGTVHSKGEESNENGGIVSNAGGLIGYMYNGKLDGNSYNLGNVSGKGYNVGGLVGHAVNSVIGNPSVVDGKPVENVQVVYNRLDVSGAYNVGGIVGNMKGTTVQNAENSGNVTATGYTDGTYSYHSAHHNKVKDETVNVANVGGIAGSSSSSSTGTVSNIIDAQNTGDVTSSKVNNQEYYAAGNVGGIVGSAVNTNITNATNKENDVRGAHNVGGVAGYFGNSNDNNDIKYTINRGINDGGDIMATGARKGISFVMEIIRPVNKNQTEKFIIGNIGGIAGYMDGDNVYITGSGNRGTVHTDEPADPAHVEEWQKAANVGGVVGKIDRSNTKQLNDENNIVDAYGNLAQAAVSDSYNTGDVLGYTGIGGIAGLMYNGEIASSYNLGYLRSTRQSHVGSATGTTEVVDALNMGGIVGDTTEESNAKALLYDVYNKGQIGDKEFNYFGRHVGGVVGRLSGTVEKAYNTGAIYNGYNVVGGIAGWVATGKIQNAFNTGNITVYNKNENTSQLGGIAGAAQGGNGVFINNVYNLGTLRSFDVGYGDNSVGGILGTATQAGTVTINNAYTTGNLYSGKLDKANNSFKEDLDIVETFRDGKLTGVNTKVNSIYGSYEYNASVMVGDNTYYIQPDKDENGNLLFTKLADKHNSAKHTVEFSNKSDFNYNFDGGITKPNGGDVDENSDWRIYDGNTPILNAFLPNAEDYFDQYNDKDKLKDAGIGSIQYGTAYDPLLTIINAANGTDELKYDWKDLGITNAAGIAVYGAGLTLNDFKAYGATGYFGGTIYTDGALNINGNTNDIGIGSAADIYGSAVNITTDGKVTIYGDVTATGNTTNDVDNSEMKVEDAGNITINAGDVDVYGTLTSATTADYGNDVKIPGIEGTAVTWNPGNVSDPYAEMSDIADRFAHTTGKSNVNGNITINAGKDEDGNAIGGGNVNIYFGNQEQGLITTGGDLQVEATGNIFVDSDLDVGGNLKLTSTGKNSEILLTLTNIGKVQADKFTGVIENFLNGKNIDDINASDLLKVIQKAYPGVEFTDAYAERIVAALTKYEESGNKASAIEQLNNDIAVAYMHQFMHNFDENVEGSNKIYLNADSGNAKLTVDMWDYNHNKYDFKKYDTKFDEHGTSHTFVSELNNLDLHINDDTAGVHADASKVVFVEVSTGEQLKAIQQAGADALAYNYALMGDINASDVKDYVAIGTGNKDAEGNEIGFTGTFDGRGNRVIGLKVNNNNANAGIFSTVGENGVVKNVNIYSGNFTGSANAGAVAGVNNGRIENIVTFGNTVTATGENSNAGGIVGVNNGNNGTVVTNEDGTIVLKPINEQELPTGIIDVESTGSVIAGGSNAVAGGLVGTNKGVLGNSYSDSAVTSTANDNQAGLGGVVGVNTENGDVQMVDSLGVTNGGSTGSSNVGGVIGINNGNMYSGYNESIVSGSSNVGGIIGQNAGKYENDKWNGGTVENVVNATGVTGSSNFVGGLVGTNTGSVTNGRNNGTITGTKYVGGLVGDNADEHSILTNLVNDSSAEILGEEYVGGIAGSNSGTITSENQANLINRGSITGQKYVGGVAGENIGTIEYVNNDVSLNVKDTNKDASYFGGVAGINGRVDDESTDDVDESVTGTITSATNEGNVIAENASYVGGIVGHNTAKGVLEGMGNSNEGIVIGGSYVGGVIGQNDAAIGSTDKSQVGITNEGIVIAVSGGAGGLIGENNAAITNTIMTNKGEVHGNNANDGSGTGGLIGTNNENGDITYSSMINEVTGTVTGVNNVGGLIGVNKADIIGGRDIVDDTGDDKDSGYYVNKIYNNGVINVGTYTYNDKDGEYKFAAATESDNSTNVGGLFGTNSGKVEAAYNTGAINAENSTNVGGIAGTNSGTIDQVFNTVMVNPADKDQQAAAITGGNNVGGLIGTNSGTLSNAYNTTDVIGTTNVGNAVGVNAEVNSVKGQVSNVYDVTNTDYKLIGENNGNVIGSYSGNETDKNITGITYVGEGEKLKEDTYKDSLNNANTWKFYDGQQTPLLNVFLTKVKIDQNKVNEYMSKHKVYNGTKQELTADDIKALINNGAISVEGLTKKQAFEAFYNNNDLISSIGYKDVGEHNNWLYSDQIAAGSMDNTFNPNNLGYDIELTASLAKKELSISDILANIVYGGNTYTNISGGSLKGIVGDDEVYLLDKDGYRISITSDLIAAYLSGDYATNKGNRNTADVKRDHNNNNNVIAYENAISVGGIRLGGQLSGNYTLAADSTISGDVTVTPADLKITLNDIYRIYGDHKTLYGNYEATQTGDYGIKDVIGLVNGDQDNLNELIVTAISDGALDDYANPTKTNDVTKDGYKWTGEFSGIDNVNSNYTITVGGGNSIVKAKTITIKDLLASIVYGNQDNKGLQINTGASLADGSIVYGDDVRLVTDNAQYTTGGAYEDSRGNRTTADVGEYTDSLFVSGLSLTGDKAENYVLDKTAAVGNIIVTKATLNVTLNNVEHIYGDAGLSNGTNYGISGVTGIVNSDNKEYINNSLSFVFVDGSDTALTGSTGRVTDDVGTGYAYQGTVKTTNNNYKVVVNGTNSNTGIGKSEVTKATVQINLDDITHVYGQPSDDYKIKDDIIWVNGDAYSVNDIVITDNTVDDDAIDKTTGKTNNAGGQYKWNASVDASGNNAEIINQNYNLEVVEGNSYVDQAELTINLGDITHTYGEPNKNGYTFTANGWVYGEDYSGNISIGSLGNGITDNALKDNNEHTNNANTAANPYYTWTTNDYSISGEGAVNYKITVVNDGKSYVDKANLVITADDANTTIGNMPDRFTGTDIQEQLVNGDIISDDNYHYGVSADTDVNIAGEYNIGIYINGTYYELQNPDWSSENGLGFFANYNVTFEPGTLTVSAYDIPEDWPHNRWDYLFNDAPLDRNKDFRERKAEVNFVDGGMEI